MVSRRFVPPPAHEGRTRLDASVIENLAELQAIDRRNRDRELELAEIEKEAGVQRSLLESKQLDASVAREELAQINTRKRDLEGKLQDEEQRMKDRRMRLGRLRNDKEAAALQREIESAKETNGRVEEELLTLIEQSEALEGNLKAVDEEVAAIEANVARLGEASGGRARILRSKIQADRAERETLAGRLGAALRRRYEQVFERRNGIAVVEVRDGSCRGCNITLPPQLYNRIQRRTEVESCPNCQRILVWRPDPATAAQAD